MFRAKAAVPVISATVEVTKAGWPTAAAQAFSNISITGGGITVQGRSNSRGRGRPDQEHSLNIVQGSVERSGDGEVAADCLDLGGQMGGIRVASQSADATIGSKQLRDDLAPDVTSGADDEDSFHVRPVYSGLRMCAT